MSIASRAPVVSFSTRGYAPGPTCTFTPAPTQPAHLVTAPRPRSPLILEERRDVCLLANDAYSSGGRDGSGMTGTPAVVTTLRLRAERLTVAHLPDIRAMHQDVRSMAPLGGVRDEEQTR